MEYIISASTDVGIKKATNQDSLMIKKADTPIGQIVFAVLCDGMGGLEKGEVASASVIMAFEEWFHNQLPYVVSRQPEDYQIRLQWEEIIRRQNDKIKTYGKMNGISMGTTVVLLLLTPTRYYIMHVGDSRAYEICEMVRQLTEDQTVVAKEVREGILTPQQALCDSRRSILLQCVGASDIVYPEMCFGETRQNAVYMLCSDGFVHEITVDEMYQYLQPEVVISKETLKKNVDDLIDINKQREEKDNISVAIIRTC